MIPLEDITRIKSALEKATAAPWRVADEGFVMFTPSGQWRNAMVVPLASGSAEDAYCGSDSTAESRANATLICLLRNHAPALLAELIELRERVWGLERAAMHVVAIADTRNIEADELGCKRSKAAISVPYSFVEDLRAALDTIRPEGHDHAS